MRKQGKRVKTDTANLLNQPVHSFRWQKRHQMALEASRIRIRDITFTLSPQKLVIRGLEAIRQIQLSLQSPTATHIPKIYRERTTTVVLNQAQWSLLSRVFCITLNSIHNENISNQTYHCIPGYTRLSECTWRHIYLWSYRFSMSM